MSQTTNSWLSLNRLCIIIALILAILAALGVGPGSLMYWAWVAFFASFLV